jgi:hypothetical protein
MFHHSIERLKKKEYERSKAKGRAGFGEICSKATYSPIIANHSKHEEAAAERSSQQDRRRKDRKRGVMGVRRQSM